MAPLDFNSHLLPVTFEKKYFSLCTLGVHSMLISFPWRMQDNQMEGLDLPSAINRTLFTNF